MSEKLLQALRSDDPAASREAFGQLRADLREGKGFCFEFGRYVATECKYFVTHLSELLQNSDHPVKCSLFLRMEFKLL